MARAISTDFFQNFRYHVALDDKSPAGADKAVFKTQGGFNSVSIPELTMDAVEYREGTSVYTKKFSGIPTVSEVTLMRGVTKDDTDFWRWARTAAEGGEYRADVNIKHFNRTDVNGQTIAVDKAATRIYACHECVPIRVKVTADMDATSGDVSIAEFGLAVEWMEVKIDNAAV